jgi:hypothetical protein
MARREAPHSGVFFRLISFFSAFTQTDLRESAAGMALAR